MFWSLTGIHGMTGTGWPSPYIEPESGIIIIIIITLWPGQSQETCCLVHSKPDS